MTKLVTSFGRSLIDGFIGGFFGRDGEGLVRLFETEYQTDYRQAVKSGAIITDAYVRQYLYHAYKISLS